MHSSHNLLALLPPLLLLLVAATGPARALTDDEKHVMVELHNRYRAQASPSASNMLQMTWDESLAAFAKAYAKQCVWGHNKERGRRGENLFAITDEGVDVPLAVEEWHHEREHYNLSAAACDSGQMCGHYTQVVWAKTERIGCGSHFCEKLQGVEETNIHLLVCNYEPPGNVKGQRPYLEGTPCSQCPSGYRCENSLCEPIKVTEATQNLSDLVTEVPPSVATEASSTRKTSIPSTLATETPSLVTKVSDSLATKTLPAIETKAPFSIATEDLPSIATEAQPSLTSEAPSFLANHSLVSLDEGPATFPGSTHEPVPESTDKEVRGIEKPSKSPESSLLPKKPLTGTQELLPHFQEVPEAELPSSSEVLASVFAAQAEASEWQATQDHTVHTSSKSLSRSPNTSATANAKGGRTLALQLSLPGAEGPERPAINSGLNSGPRHIWGLLLGLLLLPLLVLVGIF
ncbi:peptidase inhibitor 16 [Talpa occidentalis]|uniref:peptidase inhibitor 16 n=1 Tax=Talpa occidentalis TaxID=50954 RepID=UPI001890A525|nr:peptidase inhibitor 16 [Talpa occidentalis]